MQTNDRYEEEKGQQSLCNLVDDTIDQKNTESEEDAHSPYSRKTWVPENNIINEK